MLFSNCVANFIGVAVNIFLTHSWEEIIPPEALSDSRLASMIFLPLSFFIPLFIISALRTAHPVLGGSKI